MKSIESSLDRPEAAVTRLITESTASDGHGLAPARLSAPGREQALSRFAATDRSAHEADRSSSTANVSSWNYPDALHVDGAVWAGQQAGVLPMPDRRRLQASGTERKMLDTRAYLAALRALHALGAAFDQRAAPDAASSGKAMVLLETMLWTRFSADGQVEPHVTGPEPGDLVVVTDDPVVRAIADGRLNLSEATEQGFIRLYGTPEQERDFLERFGDLGDEPLPPMDARKLLSGVRSGQR